MTELMADYATEPVPAESRRSLASVSFVLAGVPLCVAGLLAGAAVSQILPLAQGLEAAVIGGVIVTIYAAIIGVVGARTGCSTTLLLQEAFGRIGAALVTVVLAVCLSGWYAVQTGFFGQTIQAIFPAGGVLTSTPIAALWGGLLMLSTAYFGFRGLSFLSMVAVPLIIILAVWGVWAATGDINLWSAKPEMKGTIGQAVTLVVGSFAVGATVNADITRYSRNVMHALIATIIGFFIANVFILVSGAVTAAATGSGDLIAAMTILGLGVPALLILVLGQWTTNDNNLYAVSLNMAGAFPQLKKSHLVVVCGLGATICAVFGIADRFVPFLLWLGILIPPIGGVLIAHHVILKNRWLSAISPGRISVPAFLAWLAGSATGALLQYGAPAVNSIVTSLIVYSVIKVLRR